MGWFTKTVKVVDRPIPGEASRVKLYEAYKTERTVDFGLYATFSVDIEHHLGYYLSCADAFKDRPGCKVKELTGIRIGDEYFAVHGLTAVTVTKPKRGKGKA
jgi:hypothetical protein